MLGLYSDGLQGGRELRNVEEVWMNRCLVTERTEARASNDTIRWLMNGQLENQMKGKMSCFIH